MKLTFDEQKLIHFVTMYVFQFIKNFAGIMILIDVARILTNLYLDKLTPSTGHVLNTTGVWVPPAFMNGDKQLPERVDLMLAQSVLTAVWPCFFTNYLCHAGPQSLCIVSQINQLDGRVASQLCRGVRLTYICYHHDATNEQEQ